MVHVETIDTFAKFIFDLAKTDRDVIVASAGMTGEGKSTFMILLQIAYAKVSGTKWDMSHLTWSRTELLEWIDGDKDGKNKKPEYSGLLPDELISLFYKRNWYEDPQKSAVELLNKCRDRHLFIGGNIPNFWDLDGGFLNRIRYYVYIPRGRSIAWVFEQEDNPFNKDPWNYTDNKRVFRKGRNPYKCPNFVCEIHFGDLSPKQKEDYLAIRNTKRVNTEGQNKKDKTEKYGRIKKQRNILLRTLFKLDPSLTNVEVSELLEGLLSKEAIRLVREGLRE